MPLSSILFIILPTSEPRPSTIVLPPTNFLINKPIAPKENNKAP